jgi:hypothetical protein
LTDRCFTDGTFDFHCGKAQRSREDAMTLDEHETAAIALASI